MSQWHWGTGQLETMAGYQFPEWTEKFKLLVGVLVLGGPVYLVLLAMYGQSAEAIRIGYRPAQPIPYSHALHAGELGIDCRYCHNTVEESPHAAIPPATTCMNCHETILPQSELLAPIRDAAENGTPIKWVRVHDLPDYVFFNHSAHVTRGVGCESCHGRVDKMVEVHQDQALTMGWCLDCHRAPEAHLRDPAFATTMGYVPAGGDQMEAGAELREKNQINPPQNCSTCHR